MKRLRNGYEIDRFVGKSARLGTRDSILDVESKLRLRQLLLTRVGRNDAIEVVRKTSRGLPVSGAAVECQAMRARETRNEIKQRFRIFGPIRRVESGPL